MYMLFLASLPVYLTRHCQFMETYGSEINSYRTRNGPETMFQVCKTKLPIRIAQDHTYVLFKLTNSSNKTIWDEGLQLLSAEERSDSAVRPMWHPRQASTTWFSKSQTRLYTGQQQLWRVVSLCVYSIHWLILSPTKLRKLSSLRQGFRQNCHGRDEMFMVKPKKSCGRPWWKRVLWQKTWPLSPPLPFHGEGWSIQLYKAWFRWWEPSAAQGSSKVS